MWICCAHVDGDDLTAVTLSRGSPLVSAHLSFLGPVNKYYSLIKTMFYKLIFLEQWMRWRNICVYLPGRCR